MSGNSKHCKFAAKDRLAPDDGSPFSSVDRGVSSIPGTSGAFRKATDRERKAMEMAALRREILLDFRKTLL